MRWRVSLWLTSPLRLSGVLEEKAGYHQCLKTKLVKYLTICITRFNSRFLNCHYPTKTYKSFPWKDENFNTVRSLIRRIFFYRRDRSITFKGNFNKWYTFYPLFCNPHLTSFNSCLSSITRYSLVVRPSTLLFLTVYEAPIKHK